MDSNWSIGIQSQPRLLVQVQIASRLLWLSEAKVCAGHDTSPASNLQDQLWQGRGLSPLFPCLTHYGNSGGNAVDSLLEGEHSEHSELSTELSNFITFVYLGSLAHQLTLLTLLTLNCLVGCSVGLLVPSQITCAQRSARPPPYSHKTHMNTFATICTPNEQH